MPTHLRHVVLLVFKASASRQDVQQIEEALIQLEYRIDEVAALDRSSATITGELAFVTKSTDSSHFTRNNASYHGSNT